VLTVPPAVKLWYCPDAVDMRLGFDGLHAEGSPLLDWLQEVVAEVERVQGFAAR
jgi:hypothetical protein